MSKTPTVVKIYSISQESSVWCGGKLVIFIINHLSISLSPIFKLQVSARRTRLRLTDRTNFGIVFPPPEWLTIQDRRLFHIPNLPDTSSPSTPTLPRVRQPKLTYYLLTSIRSSSRASTPSKYTNRRSSQTEKGLTLHLQPHHQHTRMTTTLSSLTHL